MTTEFTPATGQHTSNGIPSGFTSITPFIALTEPGAAIEFYCSVFGARVVGKSEAEGQVVHADLQFEHGRLQLGVAAPLWKTKAPEGDTVDYSLGFYCPNVDEVVEKARVGGATVREEPATFVSGDRFASILDPFGVRWTIMTRVEDLSDEESARRVDEWLTQ